MLQLFDRDIAIYSCQFQAHFQKAHINLKFPCNFFIQWTSINGKNTVESQSHPKTRNSIVNFDQKLQFNAQVIYDQKKKKFLKKDSIINLNLTSKNRPDQVKLVGRVTVDLSDVLNNNGFSLMQSHNLNYCSVQSSLVFNIKSIKNTCLNKSISDLDKSSFHDLYSFKNPIVTVNTTNQTGECEKLNQLSNSLESKIHHKSQQKQRISSPVKVNSETYIIQPKQKQIKSKYKSNQNIILINERNLPIKQIDKDTNNKILSPLSSSSKNQSKIIKNLPLQQSQTRQIYSNNKQQTQQEDIIIQKQHLSNQISRLQCIIQKQQEQIKLYTKESLFLIQQAKVNNTTIAQLNQKIKYYEKIIKTTSSLSMGNKYKYKQKQRQLNDNYQTRPLIQQNQLQQEINSLKTICQQYKRQCQQYKQQIHNVNNSRKEEQLNYKSEKFKLNKQIIQLKQKIHLSDYLLKQKNMQIQYINKKATLLEQNLNHVKLLQQHVSCYGNQQLSQQSNQVNQQSSLYNKEQQQLKKRNKILQNRIHFLLDVNRRQLDELLGTKKTLEEMKLEGRLKQLKLNKNKQLQNRKSDCKQQHQVVQECLAKQKIQQNNKSQHFNDQHIPSPQTLSKHKLPSQTQQFQTQKIIFLQQKIKQLQLQLQLIKYRDPSSIFVSQSQKDSLLVVVNPTNNQNIQEQKESPSKLTKKIQKQLLIAKENISYLAKDKQILIIQKNSLAEEKRVVQEKLIKAEGQINRLNLQIQKIKQQSGVGIKKSELVDIHSNEIEKSCIDSQNIVSDPIKAILFAQLSILKQQNAKITQQLTKLKISIKQPITSRSRISQQDHAYEMTKFSQQLMQQSVKDFKKRQSLQIVQYQVKNNHEQQVVNNNNKKTQDQKQFIKSIENIDTKRSREIVENKRSREMIYQWHNQEDKNGQNIGNPTVKMDNNINPNNEHDQIHPSPFQNIRFSQAGDISNLKGTRVPVLKKNTQSVWDMQSNFSARIFPQDELKQKSIQSIVSKHTQFINDNQFRLMSIDDQAQIQQLRLIIKDLRNKNKIFSDITTGLQKKIRQIQQQKGNIVKDYEKLFKQHQTSTKQLQKVWKQKQDLIFQIMFGKQSSINRPVLEENVLNSNNHRINDKEELGNIVVEEQDESTQKQRQREIQKQQHHQSREQTIQININRNPQSLLAADNTLQLLQNHQTNGKPTTTTKPQINRGRLFVDYGSLAQISQQASQLQQTMLRLSNLQETYRYSDHVSLGDLQKTSDGLSYSSPHNLIRTQIGNIKERFCLLQEENGKLRKQSELLKKEIENIGIQKQKIREMYDLEKKVFQQQLQNVQTQKDTFNQELQNMRINVYSKCAQLETTIKQLSQLKQGNQSKQTQKQTQLNARITYLFRQVEQKQKEIQHLKEVVYQLQMKQQISKIHENTFVNDYHQGQDDSNEIHRVYMDLYSGIYHLVVGQQKMSNHIQETPKLVTLSNPTQIKAQMIRKLTLVINETVYPTLKVEQEFNKTGGVGDKLPGQQQTQSNNQKKGLKYYDSDSISQIKVASASDLSKKSQKRVTYQQRQQNNQFSKQHNQINQQIKKQSNQQQQSVYYSIDDLENQARNNNITETSNDYKTVNQSKNRQQTNNKSNHLVNLQKIPISLEQNINKITSTQQSKQITYLNTKIQQTQHKAQLLQKKVQQLLDQLDEKQIYIKTLQTQIKKHQTNKIHIQDLFQTKKQLQQRLIQKQKSIEQMQDKIQSLKNQLQYQQRKKIEGNSITNIIQNELLNKAPYLTTQIVSSSQPNHQHQQISKCQTHLLQIQSMRQQIDSLTLQINSNREQNIQLEKFISVIKTQNQALKQSFSKLNQQYTTIQYKLEQANIQIDKVKSQLAAGGGKTINVSKYQKDGSVSQNGKDHSKDHPRDSSHSHQLLIISKGVPDKEDNQQQQQRREIVQSLEKNHTKTKYGRQQKQLYQSLQLPAHQDIIQQNQKQNLNQIQPNQPNQIFQKDQETSSLNVKSSSILNNNSDNSNPLKQQSRISKHNLTRKISQVNIRYTQAQKKSQSDLTNSQKQNPKPNKHSISISMKQQQLNSQDKNIINPNENIQSPSHLTGIMNKSRILMYENKLKQFSIQNYQLRNQLINLNNTIGIVKRQNQDYKKQLQFVKKQNNKLRRQWLEQQVIKATLQKQIQQLKRLQSLRKQNNQIIIHHIQPKNVNDNHNNQLHETMQPQSSHGGQIRQTAKFQQLQGLTERYIENDDINHVGNKTQLKVNWVSVNDPIRKSDQSQRSRASDFKDIISLGGDNPIRGIQTSQQTNQIDQDLLYQDQNTPLKRQQLNQIANQSRQDLYQDIFFRQQEIQQLKIVIQNQKQEIIKLEDLCQELELRLGDGKLNDSLQSEKLQDNQSNKKITIPTQQANQIKNTQVNSVQLKQTQKHHQNQQLILQIKQLQDKVKSTRQQLQTSLTQINQIKIDKQNLVHQLQLKQQQIDNKDKQHKLVIQQQLTRHRQQIQECNYVQNNRVNIQIMRLKEQLNETTKRNIELKQLNDNKQRQNQQLARYVKQQLVLSQAKQKQRIQQQNKYVQKQKLLNQQLKTIQAQKKQLIQLLSQCNIEKQQSQHDLVLINNKHKVVMIKMESLEKQFKQINQQYDRAFNTVKQQAIQLVQEKDKQTRQKQNEIQRLRRVNKKLQQEKQNKLSQQQEQKIKQLNNQTIQLKKQVQLLRNNQHQYFNQIKKVRKQGKNQLNKMNQQQQQQQDNQNISNSDIMSSVLTMQDKSNHLGEFDQQNDQQKNRNKSQRQKEKIIKLLQNISKTFKLLSNKTNLIQRKQIINKGQKQKIKTCTQQDSHYAAVINQKQLQRKQQQFNHKEQQMFKMIRSLAQRNQTLQQEIQQLKITIKNLSNNQELLNINQSSSSMMWNKLPSSPKDKPSSINLSSSGVDKNNQLVGFNNNNYSSNSKGTNKLIPQNKSNKFQKKYMQQISSSTLNKKLSQLKLLIIKCLPSSNQIQKQQIIKVINEISQNIEIICI